MEWLAYLVGGALIVLSLTDVFFTVLIARSDHGLFSTHISRGIWWFFRKLSRIPKGKKLLTYCGATILVTLGLTWFGMILLGFALIYWPHLGVDIVASGTSKPTDLSFWNAVYFSGFCVTTLGVGDVYAKAEWIRMLAVVEAATGFSVLTLVISYIISVYGALVRRRAFALRLHFRTSCRSDVAEYVVKLGAGGSFTGAIGELSAISSEMMDLFESQHAYPILNFFRLDEYYYGLPTVMYVILDTAALLQSALNEKEYNQFVRSPGTTTLWAGGIQLVQEFTKTFLPERELHQHLQEPTEEQIEQWTRHYHGAWRRLRHEGIAVRPDDNAHLNRYLGYRRRWNGYVRAIAGYLEYDWDQITKHECDPGDQPSPWSNRQD